MHRDDGLCNCFGAPAKDEGPHELDFHREEQDTSCDAWNLLLEMIERCALDGTAKLDPSAHLNLEDWNKIITLPGTISKLKRVKTLFLYGSNLVRIPPTIGDMQQLEVFDVYTSYRLHWLPFEIMRCENLRYSAFSTRALYGNYKFRPPFPSLPSVAYDPEPEQCSICGSEIGVQGSVQRWISLHVARDVVPLLVHACSMQCIERLPAPATGYIPNPHLGGLGIVQPPRENI